MANTVTETFYTDTNWVCPAGVTSVTVRALYNALDTTGTGAAVGYEQAGSSFYKTNYGTIYSWGRNDVGQLGLSDLIDRSSPVAVSGITVSKLFHTSNTYETCFAINTSGQLYAWGRNTNGNLGDGTSTNRSSPTLVVGGYQFVNVFTAGIFATLGITNDGSAYTWGLATYGLLGDNTTTTKSSPVLVVGGLKWKQILFDNASAVGLTTSGDAYSWGRNQYGQLGVGDQTDRSSPTAVIGGHKFIKITGGTSSFYGLTKTGSVYAWGQNAYGNLGNGTTSDKSSPTLVSGNLVFKDIFSNNGGSQFFGLTASGSVYSCGDNNQGRLGVGDTTNRSTPTLVLGGLKVRSVYSNSSSTFFVTTTNEAYGSGYNTNGDLGVGDTTNRSSPTLVLGGLKVLSMSTENNGLATGFVTTSGKIYACGSNTYGNLGTGDVTKRSSPVLVLNNFGCQTQPLSVLNSASGNQSFSVIPGETYPIVFEQMSSSFNGQPLCQGPIDKIVVSYTQ